MMFFIKIVFLYSAIYAILFMTGFGVACLFCRGKNEQYRYWLAPLLGVLLFSVPPIYFSVLGINSQMAGWAILLTSGCYSVYRLIKEPPAFGGINRGDLALFLAISLAAFPSLLVVLKAGYLTSTLESYSAFITIPADYLLRNPFNRSVQIDFCRPVTNLLAEVINNREYFGPFFLNASLAGVLGIPPFRLYLVLSGIITSFLPVSAFIASKEAFGLPRRWALLISLLVAVNYSFFVWQIIGQMPMISGVVFLILIIGFIPAFFEKNATTRDYALYSAFIAGLLSMYWILIPYVAGIFLLYSLLCFRSFSTRLTPLDTGLKLTAGALLINPFTLIFLFLHGSQIVATTSQFTNNVTRYPYLEELLGFGQHFSMSHDASTASLLLLCFTAPFFLLILIGCYERFVTGDRYFTSVLAVFLFFGTFFYFIDFTYHFYKNAVIGTFILLSALTMGARWCATRFNLLHGKALVGLLLVLFAGLNLTTMINYSLAERRLINESLMSLDRLTDSLPADSLILVSSFDPTEEAWISYFLRDKRIKLRGSVERWGFWILAPFSGKPDSRFFFDPQSDRIACTLFANSLTSKDIIHPDAQQLIAANDLYRVAKGLPDPYLYKGWYPAEEINNRVYRWMRKESVVIFGKGMQDYVLQIEGEIPAYYTKPLELRLSLNGENLGQFESGPALFGRKFLLDKQALSEKYNLLSIRLNRTFTPDSGTGTGDMRNLGIAVNSIALMPGKRLQLNGLIDVGNSNCDKYLIGAWSLNEALTDGTTYRWILGEKASLGLYLQEAKSMKMELRVLPFRYPGCAAQQMTIYVNGDSLGRIRMVNQDWLTYHLDIPADVLRKGLNQIDFAFKYSASPSEVIKGSEDTRNLSVAFDYIRLSPTPQNRSLASERQAQNP